MAYEETETVSPDATVASDAAPATDTMDKKSAEEWQGRIKRCKRIRRELVQEWSVNIDYRRGKPFETDSDVDRIAVNLDWPRTKAKQASLFSQVPTITAVEKNSLFKPAAAPFAKSLNEELKRAKVAVAMDECLPDVINASGIAGVIVGYESRMGAPVQVPSVDPKTMAPEVLQQMMAAGTMKMESVPNVTDKRFFVRRVSPADLLWPAEFTGSDFDDAPWIGRSGRISWSEAKHDFNLTDADKEEVCNGDSRTPLDKMTTTLDKEKAVETDIVSFDEIYYWDYRYNPEQEHFKCIKRLVFVDGKDVPVVHEKWKGQKFIEGQGRSYYVGACVFPIRVSTLTYISDEAIPPSDSAVGRPQVDELIAGRSESMLQRKRSVPIRWFDSNRVDSTIQALLLKGTWQGMLPSNGDGSRTFGEVARSNYPNDDYVFDRISKADLDEIWQTSPNQSGSFATGERSAAEAKIVQGGFQARNGYERARIANFFLGIAEVMAGLMVLYGDFDTLSDEEKQALEGSWDRNVVNQLLAFTIRPDSTVLLDSDQRIEKLVYTLNVVGKSGFVNPAPIIEEIIALVGLDPAKVMAEPKTKEAESPSISMRFSGIEVLNPLVLAMLMESGQAPSPDSLKAAQTLLASLNNPLAGMSTPGGTPEGQQPPVEGQPQEAPEVGAHPDWEGMPRVNKRNEEFGG